MRRLLALLLAAALPACSASDSSALVGPWCASNRDCPSGQLCYEDGCGSAVDFAVRVTPNADAYAVQDFNLVNVAMNRMNLTLTDPGMIDGTVQVLTGGQTIDYTGGFHVEATGRSSVIAGLAFPHPLSSSAAPGSSRLSMVVPAGVWTLRVTPKAPDPLENHESPAEPALAPVFVEKAVGAGEVVDPKLVLAADGLAHVRGRLEMEPGSGWPENRPIFFRFRALDAAAMTPLSQAGVFLSTHEFHVYTAPPSGPIILRVSPDMQLNPDAVAPSKDFRSDEWGAFSEPFAMGDWGSPVEVAGVVQAPGGSPIADADVRAEGRVRGGGSYSATVTTGHDGRFTLKLLPSDPGSASAPAAKYTLTAHPPFGSPFSRSTSSFSLGDSAISLGAPIVCSRKVTLSGRVLGPRGDDADELEPLENVQVVIEGNPNSANPGPSAQDVLTGKGGTWSAEVEPGDYRVVAQPRAPLPFMARQVSVAGPTVAPDIELSPGREVAGTLVYQSKSGATVPLEGATVTVYRSASRSSSVAPAKLYEATTGVGGQFKVILPKAEEDGWF